MNQLWQMWVGGLTPEAVQRIINRADLYPIEEAKLGFEGDQKEKKSRSSTVRWVDVRDPDSKFIKDIIMYYANSANRNAFGVDLTDVWDIQYTIYDAKDDGHYDWHFDTFWANPNAHDRKLSVTVQLTDGSEYEGGNFEIDPQYEQPDRKALRTLGTVLVFPSPIRHKVHKVTKGVRKSLVAWVEGPKWK